MFKYPGQIHIHSAQNEIFHSNISEIKCPSLCSYIGKCKQGQIVCWTVTSAGALEYRHYPAADAQNSSSVSHLYEYAQEIRWKTIFDVVFLRTFLIKWQALLINSMKNTSKSVVFTLPFAYLTIINMHTIFVSIGLMGIQRLESCVSYSSSQNVHLLSSECMCCW